ncbi:Olfactory receptor 7D4 [Sciurus carolinensis]|uniref:Olfactory receptor 7D4 n=1 Tax=Sciurus carolinensis TaxID=30640 RepID=A0AA41NFJ4_SCICA|nr:Olfactory receptor 7D4 [Sciurus carolinensis]
MQPILFGLFLSMYLVTVLGSLLILLAVSSNSHLLTPMYLFLSNLKGVLASVMYTVVTPMLNPFIYRLRIRDIKSALRRMHSRTA